MTLCSSVDEKGAELKTTRALLLKYPPANMVSAMLTSGTPDTYTTPAGVLHTGARVVVGGGWAELQV